MTYTMEWRTHHPLCVVPADGLNCIDVLDGFLAARRRFRMRKMSKSVYPKICITSYRKVATDMVTTALLAAVAQA